MQTTPDITVIIPTFNRVAMVGDAIESCLSQNFSSGVLEVIVVDDGSTDATDTALHKYANQIRYVRFPTNEGRNKARNTGLTLATGAYVKFLDSDDILEPGSLRVELAAAREADADIVVSGFQAVDIGAHSDSRITAKVDPPNMDPRIDSLLAGRAVPTSAALYSRSLVDEIRWDETLHKLDDWDWFIRAAFRAKTIVRTDVISYSWRQHPGQGIRSETMLLNAQELCVILGKLERAIAECGELTHERRKRLAQYYYKECRVLSLHDVPAFNQTVSHIYELDPDFVPLDEERQWWMRALCRIFGVRLALQSHSALKRLIKRRRVKLQ